MIWTNELNISEILKPNSSSALLRDVTLLSLIMIVGISLILSVMITNRVHLNSDAIKLMSIVSNLCKLHPKCILKKANEASKYSD